MMASSIHDPIRKLMSENNFVFESDENLTCTICKQLMIDACQSFCGCQFCYECIRDYIGHGECEYCPGNKDYCKDDPLVLDGNVFRNSMLNKKISKLKVCCPHQWCLANVGLLELNDHLRVCGKEVTECPYLGIGCNTDGGTKDDVRAHLDTNALHHTQLLIELIQDMRNEFSILKNDSVMKNREIVSLKDELLEVRQEMAVRVNERTEELMQIITNQERQIDQLTLTIHDIRTEVRDNLEVKLLKEQSNIHEVRISTLENELRAMHVDREGDLKQEQNDNKESVFGQTKDNNYVGIDIINDLKKDIKKIREEIKSHNDKKEKETIYWIKWNHLMPNVGVDYVWRVEQCSQKMDAETFSESFYSHNYRLCLHMVFDNDTYVGLNCVIMKGDNDDKVQWPMRQTVTLSIIDQVTLEPVHSDTFVYDSCLGNKRSFDRPTKDRNVWFIGSNKFIKYSSIKDNASIIVDDSIVVSCVINDS